MFHAVKNVNGLISIMCWNNILHIIEQERGSDVILRRFLIVLIPPTTDAINIVYLHSPYNYEVLPPNTSGDHGNINARHNVCLEKGWMLRVHGGIPHD